MRKFNDLINEGLWDWIKKIFKAIFGGTRPKQNPFIINNEWTHKAEDALHTIDTNRFKKQKELLNQFTNSLFTMGTVGLIGKSSQSEIKKLWEEMMENWYGFLTEELVNIQYEDGEIDEPDDNRAERENPEEETPSNDQPDSETPDSETPDSETSDSETPDSETPDSETSDSETPDSETSDSETPDSETSDSETPDSETSDSETPDNQSNDNNSSNKPEDDNVTIHNVLDKRKDSIKRIAIRKARNWSISNGKSKKTSEVKNNDNKKPMMVIYVDAKNNKYTTKDVGSNCCIIVDDDCNFKISSRPLGTVLESFSVKDWVMSFFKDNTYKTLIDKLVKDGVLYIDAFKREDNENEKEYYSRLWSELLVRGNKSGVIVEDFELDEDGTITFDVECPEFITASNSSEKKNAHATTNDDDKEGENKPEDGEESTELSKSLDKIQGSKKVTFTKGGSCTKQLKADKIGEKLFGIAISKNGTFKVTTNTQQTLIEVDKDLNFRMVASIQYINEDFVFFKPLIKEESTKDIIYQNYKKLTSDGIMEIDNNLEEIQQGQREKQIAQIIRETPQYCFCGKLKEDFKLDKDGILSLNVDSAFLVTTEDGKTNDEIDKEEADNADPSEEKEQQNSSWEGFAVGDKVTNGKKQGEIIKLEGDDMSVKWDDDSHDSSFNYKNDKDIISKVEEKDGKFDLKVGDKVKDKDGNKIGEVTDIEDEGKFVKIKDKDGNERRYSYEQYPDYVKDDDSSEEDNKEGEEKGNNEDSQNKIEQIKQKILQNTSLQKLIKTINEEDWDEGYIKMVSKNIVRSNPKDVDVLLMVLKDELNKEKYDKIEEIIKALVEPTEKTNESIFNLRKPLKKFSDLYF